MTATEVTGFVIDAMRKIESADIGTWLATFCSPNAAVYRMPSRSATMATSPGIFVCSTACRRYAVDRLAAGEPILSERPARRERDESEHEH